ncbi:hypothetical protein [Acetobacterium malicum]|uniref:hypothetical protein n=1 Tax=Acetobacterium malicum TaxID=52692 RepID=UPI0035940925
MKNLVLLALFLLSTIVFTGCINTSDFKDPDLQVPSISVASSSIVDGKLLTATAADRKPNDPIGLNQSPALSWTAVYIPTGELHLHGHLDPASVRMRTTLTEADPVVTNC